MNVVSIGLRIAWIDRARALNEFVLTDTSLEYEDSHVYDAFKNYYYELLDEFRKYGRVIQLKICCNYQDYLRGNVYVQYER